MLPNTLIWTSFVWLPGARGAIRKIEVSGSQRLNPLVVFAARWLVGTSESGKHIILTMSIHKKKWIYMVLCMMTILSPHICLTSFEHKSVLQMWRRCRLLDPCGCLGSFSQCHAMACPWVCQKFENHWYNATIKSVDPWWSPFQSPCEMNLESWQSATEVSKLGFAGAGRML